MKSQTAGSAPPAAFSGFSSQGLRFLRDLEKHNERTWFQPRKPVYETELLEPLRSLLVDVNAAFRKAKIPLAANPRGSIFRIYRDIRFSPDKSPYKTNLGAYFSHDGDHGGPGGLYVHIKPKESFVAVGFYQLDKPLLQRWRESMAEDSKGFGAVLRGLERKGTSLSESHESLKRMPRGFENQAESPLAKYFRMQTFMTSDRLSDEVLQSPALIERMVSLAKSSKPLLEYGWKL
ncbi:MAG: DUF2461 domain-containing protein [Candidatus Eremiobacteraeota bacterium]|nr:DUF2461 domain-containing protein [Candidatus Eremiobacteraeota bacterium]